MPNDTREMIHECLRARGKHADCSNCRLKDEYCPQLLPLIERFDNNLQKKFFWLHIQDRKDIVQEGVTAICDRINELRYRSAFSGWAWSIFANRRDSFLRDLGGGARRKCSLPTPPANIDDLCDTHSTYISWSKETRELSLTALRLPHRVMRTLLADAHFPGDDRNNTGDEWMKKVTRLYRYSRQPVFTELDDSTQPEMTVDGEKEDDDKMDFFLRVFNSIKGQQAKNCIEVFKQLLAHDHDRKCISQSTGQSEDALKQQISRCYRLYREKILDVLKTIASSQGRFCFSLLSQLFNHSSGLQEGINDLARDMRISTDEVMNQIRRCRLLALRALGGSHG